MTQKNIIKMLSGAKKLARESSKLMISAGSRCIEDNIIKGNYVSREEHESLKKIVLKLEKTVSDLAKE